MLLAVSSTVMRVKVAQAKGHRTFCPLTSVVPQSPAARKVSHCEAASCDHILLHVCNPSISPTIYHVMTAAAATRNEPPVRRAARRTRPRGCRSCARRRPPSGSSRPTRPQCGVDILAHGSLVPLCARGVAPRKGPDGAAAGGVGTGGEAEKRLSRWCGR